MITLEQKLKIRNGIFFIPVTSSSISDFQIMHTSSIL